MAQLLKISTAVTRKRNTVEIDKKDYELRDIDELSIKDMERLKKAGSDLDVILKKKNPKKADNTKAISLMDFFLSKVFVTIDRKVYARLSFDQKAKIAFAFTEGAEKRMSGLPKVNPRKGKRKNH